MPVYEYMASIRGREDHVESGRVRARDEKEARKKLEALQFDRVKLKMLEGMASFFGAFTADVK